METQDSGAADNITIETPHIKKSGGITYVPPTSLENFKKLPADLRCMIWEMIPSSRCVQIYLYPPWQLKYYGVSLASITFHTVLTH